MPGIQYQYRIEGQQDSSTLVRVCVAGGTILGTSDTCITDSSLYQVQVIWSADSLASGTITVTIGEVVQTFSVTMSPALSGGIVDTSAKVQFIDSASVPASIGCSPAIGGTCSASYAYQWQQSADNIAWVDIDSATSQDLSFSQPVTQNTYYRRRVVENTSGTIAFADVAAVFIKPSTIAYFGNPSSTEVLRYTAFADTRKWSSFLKTKKP